LSHFPFYLIVGILYVRPQSTAPQQKSAGWLSAITLFRDLKKRAKIIKNKRQKKE
jgi:hypothetical protein